MGREEACLDVKLTVFTFYELITQDSSFREHNLYTPENLPMSQVLGLDDWELHPDIILEEGVPVSKYRQMVVEWVKARECMDAELRDGKDAPESIDWPDVPGDPLAVDPARAGIWWRGELQWRPVLTQHNLPFLEWYVCGNPRFLSSCPFPAHDKEADLISGRIEALLTIY